jgi:hypothetical protein
MAADPMQVRCAQVGLDTLDKMSVDALVLAPFSDDIPLKGAAGYCDWRMNGRLSRLLESGMFSCKPKEVLLTNTQDLIGCERVFLFGQGKRYGMDLTIFQRSMGRVIEVVKKALMGSYAIELPGVDPGPLSVPQAISAFLDAAATIYPEGKITLISPYPRFSELAAEITADDKRIDLGNA